MASTADRRLWIPLALRVVLPSALCIVLFSVALFVIILPAFERGLLARKQEMLRCLAQTACGILEGYETRAQAGEFSRAEAQARALAHLRRLRYGDDGKDYFWINDLHPRMVMHPYQPELEQKDLTEYRDPHGKRLFMEAVDVVRRQGSGYVSYMWQWKDDPRRVVPKLSYVREFPPWGWIVGTGVYLEDVAAEIRVITRKLTLTAVVVIGMVSLLSSCVIWQSYQSERKHAQAQHERAALQEQLHQAQKMEAIGQLAGSVAHDFNNLLTVIAGNTGPIVRALPDNRDVAQALEAIEHAVEQASGLTHSLLTFSRKLPVDKKPVDLCAEVDNAGRLLRGALPKTVKLAVSTDCRPAPWVYADATQLQQVLLNLAINARDAMPAGGTLRIAVARTAPPGSAAEANATGDWWAAAASLVYLEVSDTGMGIPPEIQARIFEPFFTTKERGQHTGLGLAIVHGIVQDHGGHIAVRSAVGAGTTFVIALPCVASDAAAGAQTLPTASAGHGELLLLGEANQQAREIMAAELRALGYEVVQVADGLAVLAEHQQYRERLRLFILDVDLPNRRGPDCVRTLRADGTQTPVILTAGKATADVIGESDPATAVLRKPFQMAELGRLVSAMLGLGTAAQP